MVIIVAFCAVILVVCLVLALPICRVLALAVPVPIVLAPLLLMAVLVVLGCFPIAPIRIAIRSVLAVVAISATIVLFAVVAIPLAVVFSVLARPLGIMGVVELVWVHSAIGSIAQADAEVRQDAGFFGLLRLFAISPVLHG